MLVRNNLFYNYPPVIHAPDTGCLWEKILQRFTPLKTELDDRLTIILWNNFPTSSLEDCLCKRDIPFLPLGKHLTVWNNLQKFSLNLAAFKEIRSEYVMGLDSHDVLLLGQLPEIVEQFKKSGCDMLFNAETKFYPNLAIPYCQDAKCFQESIASTKYRYLNSGAWIGKLDFCSMFFEECSKINLWELFDCTGYLKLYNCDQSVVHGVFQRYYPRVQLDYFSSIFNNIALINPGEVTILDKWY